MTVAKPPQRRPGGWERRLPGVLADGPTPEWVEIAERPIAIGSHVVTPIPFQSRVAIDGYITDMLWSEPFYSAIFMKMGRVVTEDIQTLAVTWANGRFTLLSNPNFIQYLADAHREVEIHTVLKHEALHLILGHLTDRLGDRRRSQLMMVCWNWATDSAINSMLVHGMGKVLPLSPILPGLRPGMPFNITKDPIHPLRLAAFEKWAASEPSPLERAVMTAPKGKSAEFYFERYWPLFEKHGPPPPPPGLSPLGSPYEWDGTAGTDDHELWEACDTEDVDFKAEAARVILKEAIAHADTHGWGTVPASIREVLRALTRRTIDWREELAEWVGMHGAPAEVFNTRKRLHRKYPDTTPGRRRMRGLRVLVGVDQSGSMSNALLSAISAEIAGLLEEVSITFVPFDVTVDHSNIVEWEKGDVPEFKRVRSGGTSFKHITDFANSEENRDAFDLFMICTDGFGPEPPESRIPRLWVLPQGNTLPFVTGDKVIRIPQP